MATTFHSCSQIEAPIDVVWHLLSNVVLWSTWLPTVSEVRPLAGKELLVGAAFRLLQPRLRPATWIVTDIQNGESFTWHTRSPGLKLVAVHRLYSLGPDSTEARLDLQMSGILSLPVSLFVGKLSKEYLHIETVSLKDTAEEAQRRSVLSVASRSVLS
jgi:hypothetical protein